MKTVSIKNLISVNFNCDTYFKKINNVVITTFSIEIDYYSYGLQIYHINTLFLVLVYSIEWQMFITHFRSFNRFRLSIRFILLCLCA